jgi:hypothetical protein
MVKRLKRGASDLTRVAINRNGSTGDSNTSPVRTYFSLYCYAWDVLDEGPDSFARLAEDLGLTNISMAASYHGGKALLPHNAEHHVYFIEEGAVYFQPSRRFFGTTKMKPRVSRLAADRDIFRDIVEACGKQGVATTAWTVAIHNTHLGTEYPELTTQNVFGDRYFHSLCPSQPDVMAYMRALAANLASYPIEAVAFETLEFIPFRHYGFLEKEGIGVTPLAGLLLSLCFCPACLLVAKRSRINAGAVGKAVKLWLNEYFEGKHRSLGPIESGVSSIPGLAEYLDMRFNVLADGFKEVAELLHAEKKKVISIVMGQECRLDYLTGVDLQRVAKDADAIDIPFYNRHSREAAGIVRTIRKAAGRDINVYFAVRPGHPDAEDVNGVIRMTNSILTGGGKGISYYNFGLLEKFHLDWVRRAIAQASYGKHKPSRVSGKGNRYPKSETTGDFLAPNVLRPVF